MDEMLKLIDWLEENGEIDYRVYIPKGLELMRVHFNYNDHYVSVIFGRYTYGSADGLLEMLIYDDDEGREYDDFLYPMGWLSCKDVVRILKERLGKYERGAENG